MWLIKSRSSTVQSLMALWVSFGHIMISPMGLDDATGRIDIVKK